MREILFRGKRTDNGEWTYGYYCPKPYSHFPCEATIFPSETIDRDWHGERVDPDTVGQFTGLTDKNGTKIFEGDIVAGTAYSSECIGVIVWIDEIGGFGVRYRSREDPTSWENSSILKAVSMGRQDNYAAQIIGNIYDNPELLEVSKND